MKSKIDIIIETVKHYNANNTARNVKTNICTYMNEDGAMCAVGRCLTEEGMKIFKAFEDKNLDVNTSVEYFTNVYGIEGMKIFKAFEDKTLDVNTSVEYFINVYGMDGFNDALNEEYRGHDVVFWKNLQYLHDSTYNWNEDGITQSGLESVDSLFGKAAYVMVKKALAR